MKNELNIYDSHPAELGCDDNSGVDKYGNIKVRWGYNYQKMESSENCANCVVVLDSKLLKIYNGINGISNNEWRGVQV